MAYNITHICGYHFTMSSMGAYVIEGDRYTFTCPCGLSLHMMCNGTSMMIPHNDAYIDASFTLPPRRPLSPEVGLRYPPIRNDGAGPSHSQWTWQDCLDAPSSSRVVRSSWLGGASCKKAPSRRTSPPPPNYTFELGQFEEEEEDEEDEVIELINIEIYVEVVDLVSDSDTEEDPSEGSSLPGVF
ncbi:unnamed protein product [Lupinus luteus]|uniref:Uncharacterized protein n=1 Tax=Lupinus luteus TaxID=3873 RepID=A0AAV1XJE7_LUPLU